MPDTITLTEIANAFDTLADVMVSDRMDNWSATTPRSGKMRHHTCAGWQMKTGGDR
jgi:hypothetical protein